LDVPLLFVFCALGVEAAAVATELEELLLVAVEPPGVTTMPLLQRLVYQD
jgi:hypothetical protein